MPLLTEYDYWVLSSPERIPPTGLYPIWSIGWTEAFRLNIDQSGHLSGWVQVNGVELFGDGMSDKSIVRFLRQHPGVIIDEAPYQASGPFNYNVIAENLDLLDELLDDAAVTRAAATAALHLMRKSKVGNIKNSYNPIPGTCSARYRSLWDSIDVVQAEVGRLAQFEPPLCVR